jgi:hypothetical protein
LEHIRAAANTGGPKGRSHPKKIPLQHCIFVVNRLLCKKEKPHILHRREEGRLEPGLQHTLSLSHLVYIYQRPRHEQMCGPSFYEEIPHHVPLQITFSAL